MLSKSTHEIFKDYQRFVRKQNYKKAYHCLKILANEFPDEEGILEDIVEFCTNAWDRPDLARHWLLKLVKFRSYWADFLFLSELEAEHGNIRRAKDYLKKAKRLEKKQPNESADGDETPIEIFSGAEKILQYYEQWNQYEEEKKWLASDQKNRIKTEKVSKVKTIGSRTSPTTGIPSKKNAATIPKAA